MMSSTSGAAPPAAVPGGELKVEALWHEQVHQSRVASLSFSADGACLWSGCDAAAPRPGQEGAADPPVVAVSCKDGAVEHRAASMPACNVLLVQPLAGSAGLLCVSGDGSLLAMDLKADKVVGSCSLPGTPAAAAAAAAAAPAPATDTNAAPESLKVAAQGEQLPQQDVTQTEEEPASGNSGHESEAVEADDGMAVGAPAGQPEFIPEAGYRGHREGYLFREGSLGAGYYRKDVVRQYCATAAAGPASSNGTGGTNRSSGTAGVGGLGSDAEEQPGDVAARKPGAGKVEEARLYIQRLLRAPPNMACVVGSTSVHIACGGGLLFTSSLGSSDTSIRVWRLQPSSPPGPSSGGSSGGSSSASGSGQTSGSIGACSNGSTAPLPSCDGTLPHPVLYRTLCGHSASVVSLTLSPDGSLLYSGSYDQTIRVWSTRDWSCLRVLKGHGGGIKALAAAPDGTMLYSAAADNTIRAWSTKHWVCLRTMHGRHEDTTWPACLALSPDGSLLASGSTGPFGASTIKLFQTGAGGGREPGTCLASFAQLRYDQKAGMSALHFAPDGSILYSGATDGTLAAWRISWNAAAANRAVGLRKGFL